MARRPSNNFTPNRCHANKNLEDEAVRFGAFAAPPDPPVSASAQEGAFTVALAGSYIYYFAG